MNRDEREPDKPKRRRNLDKILFTIGYQGITIETYRKKLIDNHVQVLCDVRRNAISRKHGFSKNHLKNTCEKIGIIYKHIPELGIGSTQRKDLHSREDYNKLFEYYRKQVLSKKFITLNHIIDLIESHHRVALTCFESDINQCHRNQIALRLRNFNNWHYQIKHL